MITLVIPEPTPSLNPMLRGHWSKNHRLRKRWLLLLKAAKGQAKYWDRPQWQRARIEIERYGGRVLDRDNLRGGTKFLTDALVREGIIANDTPAVIGEPQIRQFVGKERKTIVYVEAA